MGFHAKIGISAKIQSTTRTTEFFVVGKTSGILVRFVILVDIKALGETTLHFNKDQFSLDLLAHPSYFVQQRIDHRFESVKKKIIKRV